MKTSANIATPSKRKSGKFIAPVILSDASGCLAILSAAAAVNLEFENGNCVSAGIGLTNVGPTPVRVKDAQNVLIGSDVADDVIDEACVLAAAASQPVGDHRGSEEYKRGVVNTLTGRAIRKAKSRALGGN